MDDPCSVNTTTRVTHCKSCALLPSVINKIEKLNEEHKLGQLNGLTYHDLTFIATVISLLTRTRTVWNIFSEEDDDRGLIVQLKLEQRR